jgi:hypothetical protein
MTLPRTARLVLALVLVGLAGAAGSAARIGSESRQLAWTEVSWPFLLDQWGTGQAFRCEHEGCGAEARLFVRMKRGFCNCFKGVADDDEVDRLTDFEFLGGPSQPLGPGRPVKFADMGGRMRAFAVDSAEVPYRRAVSSSSPRIAMHWLRRSSPIARRLPQTRISPTCCRQKSSPICPEIDLLPS